MAKQWVNEYTATLDNMVGTTSKTDGFALEDIKTGLIRNLKHEALYLYASSSNYNLSGVGAGVISLKQAPMLKWQAYKYDGNNVPQHTRLRQLDVIVNTPISLFYESEDLDLSSLRDSAALVGQTTGSMTESYAAFMDNEWLDMIAVNSVITGNTIKVDFSATDTDKLKEQWRVISLVANKFKQYFTPYSIGTSSNEAMAIISPFMSTNILQAFATVIGSESAFQALQSYNANSFTINGLKFVEHVFLDAKIEDPDNTGNTFWSELRSYDFTGIHALIVHREATVVAQGIHKMTGTVNLNTGNDRLISKAKFGKAVVWTNLTMAIMDTETPTTIGSVIGNTVDILTNGTLRGAEAAQIKGQFHRYVGEGTSEVFAQAKDNGITDLATLTQRFAVYEKGRIKWNNDKPATPPGGGEGEGGESKKSPK